MANTVDPKQYQIYVERQGANYIDYEKITDNANKLLSDEVDRRDKIKQDLDSRANDLFDQLGKVEMNSDTVYSDQVLDAAAQLRKSLMLDQQLLKKGKMSVNEFKQQMERGKQQMSEWGLITKEFGKYKDNYNERLKIDEVTGEPIMAPDEMIIKESSLGFAYTYDKQIYVDPITKNTYFYTPNADNSIPDFNEEPDKFMAMSNARNRFQYSNDRKQYDVGFQVKQEADMLGAIVDSYVAKFKGEGRGGTYVMTETDYTVLEEEGLLDQFVETIYSKTSGTDRGLANSADVMGEFTIAMSLEQFKKNCKGGDLCDEKYFIKVNPNAPGGMTYEFGEDNKNKDFVQERVKEDIKKKTNMQLGRKEEITSKQYEPNEDVGGTGLKLEEKNVAGFFNDYKNILTGDQDKFNASEKDLRDRANARLRKDETNTDGKQITKINRTDKEIQITFRNNDGVTTTETISLYKGDDPTKPRNDKQIYQELFGFLRPEGYGSDSFQGIENQAISGGFDYKVDPKDDNRGTSVSSEGAFTSIKPVLQSDRKVLGSDGKSYPKYSDEWKKAANKVISGGDYDGSLEYFKTNLPNELNSALQQMNLPIKNLGVNVTGIDESGGNNSFTIYYNDPYTEKRESIRFKFDTPSKSTDNVMEAMDKVILNVVSSYNNTEAGELLKKEEEKKENKSAPIK